MTITSQSMAPGHVYTAAQGTGIAWQPDDVRLWQGGQVVAQARHQTASPWDFWYTLAFRDCFPQISHWWFRSVWTGRVQLSPVQPQPLAPGTIWGYLTFDNAAGGTQDIWSITEGAPSTIATPYPPHEVQPINLPLRLVLGRLAMGIVTGDVAPKHWIAVTSLVGRDELEVGLPTTHAAAAALYGNWWLADGETAMGVPLRETFCLLQGLQPPAA